MHAPTYKPFTLTPSGITTPLPQAAPRRPTSQAPQRSAAEPLPPLVRQHPHLRSGGLQVVLARSAALQVRRLQLSVREQQQHPPLGSHRLVNQPLVNLQADQHLEPRPRLASQLVGHRPRPSALWRKAPQPPPLVSLLKARPPSASLLKAHLPSASLPKAHQHSGNPHKSPQPPRSDNQYRAPQPLHSASLLRVQRPPHSDNQHKVQQLQHLAPPRRARQHLPLDSLRRHSQRRHLANQRRRLRLAKVPLGGRREGRLRSAPQRPAHLHSASHLNQRLRLGSQHRERPHLHLGSRHRERPPLHLGSQHRERPPLPSANQRRGPQHLAHHKIPLPLASRPLGKAPSENLLPLQRSARRQQAAAAVAASLHSPIPQQLQVPGLDPTAMAAAALSQHSLVGRHRRSGWLPPQEHPAAEPSANLRLEAQQAAPRPRRPPLAARPQRPRSAHSRRLASSLRSVRSQHKARRLRLARHPPLHPRPRSGPPPQHRSPRSARPRLRPCRSSARSRTNPPRPRLPLGSRAPRHRSSDRTRHRQRRRRLCRASRTSRLGAHGRMRRTGRGCRSTTTCSRQTIWRFCRKRRWRRSAQTATASNGRISPSGFRRRSCGRGDMLD